MASVACLSTTTETQLKGTYGVWQKTTGKPGENHGKHGGKQHLNSVQRSVLVMKVAPAWSISAGAIHTSNGTNSWDLTNRRVSNSHLVSLKKVPQQPVHATITCIDVDRMTTWLPDLGMIWYDIAMNWCQYHVLVATPINKHHRLVSFVPPYTLSCIFKSCRFPGFVGDLPYFRGPCNMTRGGLAHSALESVTDIPWRYRIEISTEYIRIHYSNWQISQRWTSRILLKWWENSSLPFSGRYDQHPRAAHPHIISKNSKNWPGKLEKTTSIIWMFLEIHGIPENH